MLEFSFYSFEVEVEEGDDGGGGADDLVRLVQDEVAVGGADEEVYD